MDILVVPSWFPSPERPFNGSFFEEQAKMLVAAGHSVTVAAPEIESARNFRGSKIREEQRGGVRVIRFSIPALPVLAQGLEESTVKRAVSALLKKNLLGYCPDIIHAHSVMPAAPIAREIALRLGCPWIVTEHRPSSISSRRGRYRSALLRQSVEAASGVLTVSRPFADALEEFYGTPEVRVIDLPVPDAYFETSPTPPVGDDYVFVHISHLDENKRVEMLIRALSYVEGSAKLVVIGGDPARVAEVREYARACGVESRVECVGAVKREDVPRVLGSAHCMVLPSAVEAGGTVIGEAKALGLSVIVTETWAGLHGVDAGDGATVPIDDEASLAEAMNDAVQREWSVRDVQRTEIRARAYDRYSRESFVARQIDEYQRAIEYSKRPRMVFHAPYQIEGRPAGASRLRPKKMHDAFRAEGYQVFPIVGTPVQRSLGYKELRKITRTQGAPEFLYSENSTQPNILASSLRQGCAPFLDSRILLKARASGTPAGQFYRDVYWRFPGALRGTPLGRRLMMEIFYRLDVMFLRLSKAHVFLPSEKMGPVVPLKSGTYSALPPGTEACSTTGPDDFSLFYVGGLGSEYGLQECVKAVADTDGVRLTMCVPPSNWEKNKHDYERYLSERIRVVHAKSDELAQYYNDASACVLFVEPSEYRTFAAPVKFFEYLGNGKPILLSAGTYAGELGERLGAGMQIEYSAEAFAEALKSLIREPKILEELAMNARAQRAKHTWAARAREAAHVLRARAER